MNTGKVLLTGSRAYGTPHNASDIDLVVMLPHEVILLLVEQGDPGTTGPGSAMDADGRPASFVDATIRFGRLNLLCVSDPTKFAVWERGTQALEMKRPVTREEAVDLFKTLAVSLLAGGTADGSTNHEAGQALASDPARGPRPSSEGEG